MQLVTINQNIKGGVPVVTGTRIPVRKVAYLYLILKKSPATIAVKYYTQLSVDQIKKIIDWYEKNDKRYGGMDFR